MQFLICVCAAAVCLKPCSAQDTPCNVSLRGTGRILYSVPEFKATSCDYSWTNSTGHVLANQRGEMDDLVFNSSVTTLITHTCLEQVNYTRDCIAEGIQRTAYCFTDCRGIAAHQKTEGTTHHHWGAIASITVLVLLVLICSTLMRRNNQSSIHDVEAQQVDGFQH